MIIDFECDMPTAAVKKETEKLLKSGGGFVHRGYFKLFGKAWAAMLGMSLEDFNELVNQKGYIDAALMILEKTIEEPLTDEGYIQMMDDAGVTVGCIGTNGMWSSVEDRAAIAQKYPDRLKAFYRSSPHEGMSDVKEFERTVKELGFTGLVVSGFRENLPSNHKKYYPYYAKCVELNVPARITSALHLYTDRSIDLCRPIQLDEIACDFPELTIVSGLGGWPWVEELVAVARRQPTVFIDLSTLRPKHLVSPGSGYDVLIANGNRGLQDQMIFATGWHTQGIPIKQLVSEVDMLIKNDTIKQKWMYDNAARVLKLD
jgi:uncharacterized protein